MSFRDNKVNLALDDIIKENKKTKVKPTTKNLKGQGFRRGARQQLNRSFPKKAGSVGRIAKHGGVSSFRGRSKFLTGGNQLRRALNPNTKKLVEELALKTVNRVLASRAPRVTAMTRGNTRANRIASILTRRRFLQRPQPVQVVEEVIDEESDDGYEEESPGPSTFAAVQPARAFPGRGVRKQVIIKRVAARPVQMPIKKQIVVRRIVNRQVPARIQLQRGQRKGQQNKVLNVPRGRAMDFKNNRMFSALFGTQGAREERMTGGSSFLNSLPNVQRKGRGFSNKYANDF